MTRLRVLRDLLVRAAILAFLPAAAGAGEEDQNALLLVAQPKLAGEFYGATVLIAKPVGNRQHVGFIVNRPTPYTLSNLFPAHEASRKVASPVHFGGPVNTEFVFALVQRAESPGGRSLQLAPGLHVAFDAEAVDRIIEADAAHARFVAGLVVWEAGELEDELKRGLWFVEETEAGIVTQRRAEGLWEELLERQVRRRKGI